MSRALAIAVAALAGCSSGGGPTALHDLHQAAQPIATPTLTNDFYALPFPNDLRIKADGTVDLTLFPHMGGLLDQYLAAIGAQEHGFGLQVAMYFRFDAPIDPATLPADYAASLQPNASVFLVDVTPGSPTYDQRTPVQPRFTAIQYDFIGPNWLGVLPALGLPLREKTTYACLLTDGIKGTSGKPIVRAGDFARAIAGNAASSSDARIAAAGKAYAPLIAWLAAHPDVAPHVMNASVFTTGDESVLMKKLRDAVYAQAPAPTLDALKYDGEDLAGVDYNYEGTYQGPNFQSGTAWYQSSGGQIMFDASGVPQVDHLETLRVRITVPEGNMPAAGWPVVIYQHGTGGNYNDCIGDGSAREAAKVTDAQGNLIAQLAMICTDEVLHGTRSNAPNLDLAYFNFLNPQAVHDNPHQGALDAFSVVRLIHAIDVAAAPTTGKPIKLDVDRIYFKGHSQGGLQGPLFLSAEPEVKAAILSGAGGGLVESLLHKTIPDPIPTEVQGFFHDPIDEYHPFLNLLQGLFDDADPLTYARLLFTEPRAGLAAKSIFQTLGIVDHVTPVPNIEALMIGMGAQPVNPMLMPIANLDLTHLTWATAPVSANVAGGSATAVMLEYPQSGMTDGHFVVFTVPDAIKQSNRFLATHAATGMARLDPP
jgi:hypothetical protein